MIPLATKLVLSSIIVLLGLALCTVGRTRFQWLYDPSYWKWRAYDPIRFILLDASGNIRRTTVVVFYAVLLSLLWFRD